MFSVGSVTTCLSLTCYIGYKGMNKSKDFALQYMFCHSCDFLHLFIPLYPALTHSPPTALSTLSLLTRSTTPILCNVSLPSSSTGVFAGPSPPNATVFAITLLPASTLFKLRSASTSRWIASFFDALSVARSSGVLNRHTRAPVRTYAGGGWTPADANMAAIRAWMPLCNLP